MHVIEPIRVAHVMGKMVGGGLEAVVMNYYRHIDRSRVQFDFIVDEDSTLVPRKEIESLGGRIFTAPPYQHVVAYQRVLTKLFREQGWVIVHSHENALSVFPLRAAKRAGVPVRIAHSHSTAGRGEPIRNAMKWILRRFSNVYPTHRMACSRHAGEWLFGKGAEFEVVRNAIDLFQFDFDAEARKGERAELGIKDKTFVVGHAGRFVPQKNHAFLIEMFAEILQRNTDSLLLLVGEGPLLESVRELTRARKTADKVRFIGHREEMGRLYQAFDVFCLPSNYEGLGMVAIEAQVSGLPTICSENVPDEALVCDFAVKMSLSDGAATWAETVLRMRPCLRNGHVREAKNHGYDIVSASELLQERYADLASGAQCEIRGGAMPR